MTHYFILLSNPLLRVGGKHGLNTPKTKAVTTATDPDRLKRYSYDDREKLLFHLIIFRPRWEDRA